MSYQIINKLENKTCKSNELFWKIPIFWIYVWQKSQEKVGSIGRIAWFFPHTLTCLKTHVKDNYWCIEQATTSQVLVCLSHQATCKMESTCDGIWLFKGHTINILFPFVLPIVVVLSKKNTKTTMNTKGLILPIILNIIFHAWNDGCICILHMNLL